MTRFVSEAEVRELSLSPLSIRDAVAAAFRQRHDGVASLVPKVGLHPPTGGIFHAMPASIEGLAIVKWLTAGPPTSSGAAEVLQATTLATDPRTGRLIAVLEANRLTALRTAAVTALALSCTNRIAGSRIAFIGTGLQAHAHLDALTDLLPLRRAKVVARRLDSALRFSEELSRHGIEAEATTSARDAVCGADVVISAVPFLAPLEPFIDANWLSPDAFAAAIDLGRPWIASSFQCFDHAITDDLPHTRSFLTSTQIAAPANFSDDLTMLVSAPTTDRLSRGRLFFLPPGVAIADAAIAKLVLQRLGMLEASV